MIKKFFITGTDTNVGKTLVSCAMLRCFAHYGYKVAGCKPVSSGCNLTKLGPRSTDALSLINSSNIELKYHHVNPFALIKSTSPHIASFYQNEIICPIKLSRNIKYFHNKVDILIIEGAGGWLTPLTNHLSYADWVISERLPVILVIDIKIGCINHALLTQFAIESSKINLLGWIANHKDPIDSNIKDYLDFLKKNMNSTLLAEIPNLNSKNNIDLLHCFKFNLIRSILLK